MNTIKSLTSPFLYTVFSLFSLFSHARNPGPYEGSFPETMGMAQIQYSTEWTNWPAKIQSTVLGNSFLDDSGWTRYASEREFSGIASDLRTKCGVKDPEKIEEYRFLGRAALYGPQLLREAVLIQVMPLAITNLDERTKIRRHMLNNELVARFFITFQEEDAERFFSLADAHPEAFGEMVLQFDGVAPLFGYNAEQRLAMQEEADEKLLDAHGKKGAPLTEEDIDRMWGLGLLWENQPFMKRFGTVSMWRDEEEEKLEEPKTSRPPIPVELNYLMARASELKLLAGDAPPFIPATDEWKNVAETLIRFVEAELQTDDSNSASRRRWRALKAEARTNNVYFSSSTFFVEPKLSFKEKTIIDLATARLTDPSGKNGDLTNRTVAAISAELASRSALPESEVSCLVEAADWMLATKTNLAVQLLATQWIQKRENEERKRLRDEHAALTAKTNAFHIFPTREIPSMARFSPEQQIAIIRRLKFISGKEPDLSIGDALIKAVGFRLSEDGKIADDLSIPLDEASQIASEFLTALDNSKWDHSGMALNRPAFAPVRALPEKERQDFLESVMVHAEWAFRHWPHADLYVITRLIQSESKSLLGKNLTPGESAELLMDALRGLLSARRLKQEKAETLTRLGEVKSKLARIEEEQEKRFKRAEERASSSSGNLPDNWPGPMTDGKNMSNRILVGRLVAKETKDTIEGNKSNFGLDAKYRRERLVRLACKTAAETGIAVSEVYETVKDLERTFWAEMLLPSPAEEARSTMSRPLAELEEELLRNPSSMSDSNAVARKAAEWEKRYKIEKKWFLPDLERICENAPFAFAEQEAMRLAKESKDFDERSKSSAVRLLRTKSGISEEAATPLIEASRAKWKEFRDDLARLQDEISEGKHPDAIQETFEGNCVKTASERFGIPSGELESEVRASIRKGLETWRKALIREQFAAWEREGIKPDKVEKEEAARRIAEKTGGDHWSVISDWHSMELDASLAAIDISAQKATADANAAIAKFNREFNATSQKSDTSSNPIWTALIVACAGVVAFLLARYRRRRQSGYDVFISYRRESGAEVARALQLALKNLGYRVFFDFSSLQDGKFNENIFHAIEMTKHFVLILTDGALTRCANEGDWVRIEIERAIAIGKPIVPVCPTGNSRIFPDNLPDSMQSLRNIQISQLDMESLFEESVRKLAKQRLPI